METHNAERILAYVGFLQGVVKPEVAKNGQNVFHITISIEFMHILYKLGFLNQLPREVDLLHFRS